MRIGEVTRVTGVSERLLRYYEERGLLHPDRDVNGYRAYASADVERVRSIRWLLDAGMPTSAIVRVAHCITDRIEATVSECPELAAQLQAQRDELLDNIQTLRGALDRLDSVLTPPRSDHRTASLPPGVPTPGG